MNFDTRTFDDTALCAARQRSDEHYARKPGSRLGEDAYEAWSIRDKELSNAVRAEENKATGLLEVGSQAYAERQVWRDHRDWSLYMAKMHLLAVEAYIHLVEFRVPGEEHPVQLYGLNGQNRDLVAFWGHAEKTYVTRRPHADGPGDSCPPEEHKGLVFPNGVTACAHELIACEHLGGHQVRYTVYGSESNWDSHPIGERRLAKAYAARFGLRAPLGNIWPRERLVDALAAEGLA